MVRGQYDPDGQELGAALPPGHNVPGFKNKKVTINAFVVLHTIAALVNVSEIPDGQEIGITVPEGQKKPAVQLAAGTEGDVQ